MFVPFTKFLLIGVLGLPLQAAVLGDLKIEKAVEAEWKRDPAVSKANLQLAYEDNVLQITGTAPYLLAKERAVELAMNVRDVSTVINRVHLKTEPATHSPRSLANTVKDTLKSQIEFPVGVNVLVGNDHRVTLSGQLASFAQRAKAERLSKMVPGVTAVTNLMRVSSQEVRSNKDILSDVKERLHWDPRLNHAAIGVKVDNGVVSLSGETGGEASRTIATYAAWVAGVKNVNSDNLVVNPAKNLATSRIEESAIPSDQYIQRTLTKALMWDPRVQTDQINVTSNHGVVTLEGALQKESAKQAALEDAHNTWGVVAVKDRIQLLSGIEVAATEKQ